MNRKSSQNVTMSHHIPYINKDSLEEKKIIFTNLPTDNSIKYSLRAFYAIQWRPISIRFNLQGYNLMR